MSPEQEFAIRHQPLSGPEALKLLERHHKFPGPYMFKAVGYSEVGFEARVRGAVEKVLGPLQEERPMRMRHSSGKKYLSVTLEVEVASAEQVLEVYAGLRQVNGVITIA